MKKRIKITESQLKSIVIGNLITESKLIYKRLLKVGRVGEDVRKLQQRLKDLGYGDLLGDTGPNKDGVDGKYGDKTRKAVKEFQKKQGFPGKKRYEGGADQWDGRAGKLTIEKLNGVGGIPKKDDTEKESSPWDKIKDKIEQEKNKLEQKNKEYLEKSKLTKTPFTNKGQGDKFRKWVNDNLPKIAEKHKLDPPSETTSHKNSYVLNTLNQVLKDKHGIKIRVFDYYKKKTPDWNETSVGGGVELSTHINPVYKDKINIDKILSNSKKKGVIDNPGTKECAQFVNKFSDKFKWTKSAWDAHDLPEVGTRKYSAFTNLPKDKVDDIIELYQKIDKSELPNAGENEGPHNSEVKKLVDSIVPAKGTVKNLNIDDVVGIFWEDSPHHEEAFYKGGKTYFPGDKGNVQPGSTIKGGKGWGMNTHLGIVGATKYGNPIVFHNVHGTVYSEPADNLRIAWVKEKNVGKKK